MAAVSAEDINSIFDQFEKTAAGIPLKKTFNYNKINFTSVD
jgi:hypothetical protein